MLFQSPQWAWRAADGPTGYGFVSNIVHIYPERGSAYPAYVTVPTEFFQLLPLVFNEPAMTHAAAYGTQFYLDAAGTLWVFGIESIDGKVYCDLWPYIQSKIPPWADVALRKRR